jgi:hypothetical protein
MSKPGDNSWKGNSRAIRSGRGYCGKAKMFTGSSGGVTERNMAIDVSEEIARKGQALREMTRDLDLLKVDVDSIAIVIRWRGASAPTGVHGEEASEGEPEREGP